MRLLLDESLPIELRYEVPGHDVRFVQEIGWSGLKNGELLGRAAALFDAVLTADQNLEYQQNLATCRSPSFSWLHTAIALSNFVRCSRACFKFLLHCNRGR